jgi:hypothetical protein
MASDSFRDSLWMMSFRCSKVFLEGVVQIIIIVILLIVLLIVIACASEDVPCIDLDQFSA